MAGSKTGTSDEKKSNGNGNGLLLYQYIPSYYSRKVVFALHEKKLKFKPRIIDLYRGEQFEPWFIKLNPKSEVPVLKDGVKIIPDSRRIIDYIEDNFSNGNTPRLIPEKGSSQYQIMERMRDLLDNIPVAVVTFGCVLNPHLTGKIKMSPQELKARQGVFTDLYNLLTDLCEKHKDFKDYYLVKKTALDKRRAMTSDPNEVEKGILDIEYALKEVEKELASHEGDKKKWWLCSEKFTIADISLSVLLIRVYEIGLDERFFKDNQFLNVQEYYKRVQQRESFKKTIYQSTGILETFNSMETKEQVFVTMGSVAVVLAAAGLATFLIHRYK